MSRSTFWPIVIMMSVSGLALCFFSYLPGIRAALRGSEFEKESVQIPRAMIASPRNGLDQVGKTKEPVRTMPPSRDLTYPELDGIKIIRKLPRRESDIILAHQQSTSDTCQPLPRGEPLEITRFTPSLLGHSPLSEAKNQSIPSTRRHVLSVGFDMLASDRAGLPVLSGGEIQSYLNENYVSIQVIVRRDLLDGILYLHHRPMAAIAAYRKPALSQELTGAISTSLENYRSLGMLLRPDEVPNPRNLRTLVLIHKGEHQPLSSSKRLNPTFAYEYVFIRARQTEKEGLALNTFVTRDSRQTLHQLRPCFTPASASQASIKTDLCFTTYDASGLVPKSSATRHSTLNEVASFSFSNLHEFARSQGWKGDAMDNLSDTLDAIIDGNITTTVTVSPSRS